MRLCVGPWSHVTAWIGAAPSKWQESRRWSGRGEDWCGVFRTGSFLTRVGIAQHGSLHVWSLLHVSFPFCLLSYGGTCKALTRGPPMLSGLFNTRMTAQVNLFFCKAVAPDILLWSKISKRVVWVVMLCVKHQEDGSYGEGDRLLCCLY